MNEPRTDSSPEEMHESNGLRFWVPPGFEAWPWAHMLVTTRAGGCSEPPWDSLNLSTSTGDAVASVAANRKLLQRTLRISRWHPLEQVHEDRVLPVPLAGRSRPAADGAWTAAAEEALVVGVADCVPVFVVDPVGRRLALLHAGWRGTLAGIVDRGIDALVAAGARLEHLRVALGPSIGPCCYEVDRDVAQRFPAAARIEQHPSLRLDLRVANRLRAVARGVPESQVFATPPCTACHPQHFYSHRRLGPRTGRMWALAWISAA